MSVCNGVFAGGGVKGIGHVGAVCALQAHGYEFDRVAGSSAGAIVAALLAAGYQGKEMKEQMERIDYTKFAQRDALDRLGIVGKAASVLWHYGLYHSEYLEEWLTALLKQKEICCFQDVRREDGSYTLQVTSVDLSTQELLVLPKDLKRFGIDPDSFPIAKAVRMSISIPLFYEPILLKDKVGQAHYMVDGGLLSNYPMWILDDGTNVSEQPTFGFKFFNKESCNKSCVQRTTNLLEYLKLLVSTLLDAADHIPITDTKGDQSRSIFIPSDILLHGEEKTISTTDFSITQQESAALFENGVHAAEHFLSHWNFSRWQRRYRNDISK